jgi:hypothetical protein
MENCQHKTTLKFQNNGAKYCYDCHKWILPVKKVPLPVQMAERIKDSHPAMGNGFNCYRDGLD